MNNITIKNANILPGSWRNFSGAPDDYHPKGSRYFNVQLDEETANMLLADGWNVKMKIYDETTLYTLQVKINFDSKEPPKIKQITRGSREGTILDSESVRDLDRAYIERADVRISPYEWNINGKSGVTAYLDRLNVVLNEDDFDSIDYFEDEGTAEDYIPFQ